MLNLVSCENQICPLAQGLAWGSFPSSYYSRRQDKPDLTPAHLCLQEELLTLQTPPGKPALCLHPCSSPHLSLDPLVPLFSDGLFVL